MAPHLGHWACHCCVQVLPDCLAAMPWESVLAFLQRLTCHSIIGPNRSSLCKCCLRMAGLFSIPQCRTFLNWTRLLCPSVWPGLFLGLVHRLGTTVPNNDGLTDRLRTLDLADCSMKQHLWLRDLLRALMLLLPSRPASICPWWGCWIN